MPTSLTNAATPRVQPTRLKSRTPGQTRRRGIVFLGLTALALRVALVLALFDPGHLPFTYEHGEIAENLLAGRGFTVNFLGFEGPTSQQAPLYPALLAGLYWAFGPESPGAMLTLQLLQAAAGSALVLCLAWLSWSLLPERPAIGWAAAVLAAIHPAHIYMVTHVQVALWGALLLTLVIAVSLSPQWRNRRGAALAGLLAGLLLLIEPIMALALPILALAVARGEGRWSYQGLARAAIMAAVCTAAIAPWVWRNARVHGEFVFIKSTFGYAFWQGNNPASWGTDKVPKPSAESLRRTHDGSLSGIDRALWEARHETIYIDDLLLKPDGYRQFAGLTEPERSRLLEREAWSFIAAQPRRYAQLCLQRLRYFLLWDETNPKAANWLYRAATLAWLGLSLAGLAACWKDRGKLWPTFAICAAIGLFHTLTIVSARFRIPLEPMTFVWCGAAVAAILARVQRARVIATCLTLMQSACTALGNAARWRWHRGTPARP